MKFEHLSLNGQIIDINTFLLYSTERYERFPQKSGALLRYTLT